MAVTRDGIWLRALESVVNQPRKVMREKKEISLPTS